MEETFSPRQDMVEDVGNYLKWWKVTWGAIIFSGDMDSYWRKWASAVTHKCLLKEDSTLFFFFFKSNQESKPNKSISTFLQVQQPSFQILSLVLYVFLSKHFITSKFSCFSI